MNIVQRNLFPHAKQKAVTLSYDDGVADDRKLVEILNRFGLKASFHLNSGWLGKPGRLDPCEIRELFRGHEVSSHTVTHPHIETLPTEQLAWQILEDRRALESLVDLPVRGMSYPYGTYGPEALELLPAYGIEYARTTRSHGGFHLPEDFLQWHPTCHHNHDLARKTEEFALANPKGRLMLFYVWGHSYEFPRDNNWEVIEQFGRRTAELSESVWFATNIEIIDYLQALQQLRVSVDGRVVQNRSHLPVWVSINEQPREIAPGEVLVVDGKE